MKELPMSRIDQILNDVQSGGNATERTAALIGGIKFWVAEAFAGVKLPNDVGARLAEIFPALEAHAGAIGDAIIGDTPVEAVQVEEPKAVEEIVTATEPSEA
jgi:hypothetical protein